MLRKFLGIRVAGSKKRWFPSPDAATTGVVFKQSQFGKSPNAGGGKNATRRMTVLNKLFMKHITDLMATGEISENILGKGLQVSRVKISQDFACVNVFWMTTGDVGKDVLMETELQRCSGLLRHELSQLGLMGVVPRIKFVKDKLYTNLGHVEALLKDMDFGEEDDVKNANDMVKQEFYGNKVTQYPIKIDATNQETVAENLVADLKLPEMRHDVLGLDHKGIMLKIFTKMRKSKQAWVQHQQQTSSTEQQTHQSAEQVTSKITPTVKELSKINVKLAQAAENSEKFEQFLAQRRERRDTPERKKYRATYDLIGGTMDEYEEREVILSARQKQLYDAEDYLPEEVDNKKT